MIICGTPGCNGHLGKFASCLAEAIWQLSVEGWELGSTGSTDFQGHYSLVSVLDEEEQVTLDSDVTVMLPEGTYVVYTSPSGFVDVVRFENADEAWDVMERAATQYAEWEDSNG